MRSIYDTARDLRTALAERDSLRSELAHARECGDRTTTAALLGLLAVVRDQIAALYRRLNPETIYAFFPELIP